MSRFNRRDMLGVGLSGAAALTLPTYLANSGKLAQAALADDAPADPFLDWFGIDERAIAKVMAELMSGGADFAHSFK
jgi:TldD protein